MRSYSAAECAVAAEMAREDFYFFSRWMFLRRKGFPWRRAAHHALIAQALTRVFRGQCRRLIVNVPPRYSKTELAVVNWIAWCLGKVPDSEFIHTSYSATLAALNASNAQGVVEHEAYREVFPKLRIAKNAQAHWTTTDGGTVYAAGSGGTLTGFGAGKHREGFGGAIIIDDPHKADEARSDVIRKGVIEWFQNTLESRKNSPDTPIILIMQRLHQEDLAGWLLGGGNGEKWEHLCLPALQDDGTALWPEKHDVATLQTMQSAAPYTFSGQYQQRPSPPEGLIFKPDMIAIVDAIPVGTRFVRGWDFAGTTDGDWTAGVKLGLQPNGRYLIADVVRVRERSEKVEAALLNAANRDGSMTRIRIPQDPGQAGKAQVAHMSKMLSGFTVKALPATGDKVTRAEPFASQVNVGNVDMLKAEWNDALVNELRTFPAGKHDDQVDAASDAFAEHTTNTFGLLDFMAQEAERLKQQQ